LAVLNGKPRSATVKTESEVTILELSKEDFLQLVTGKVRKTLELQVNKMYKTPAHIKAAQRLRTESKDAPNPTRAQETVIINTDDVSKNNKEKLSRAKLMQELHPALVTMLTKHDASSMSPMLGAPPMLQGRRNSRLPSVASKYSQKN
jgi:CRP-like cAMP-binding protein